MTPTIGDDDQVVLLEPASAGQQGPKPDLIRLPSFKHEVDYLANRVQQLHERDIPWNEIAIIYRSNFMGLRIYNHFQQAQIPIEWVNASSDTRNYNPAELSIKLIIMHSSKGLEFPVVLIPGIGYLPDQYGHGTPVDRAWREHRPSQEASANSGTDQRQSIPDRRGVGRIYGSLGELVLGESGRCLRR